MEGMVVMVVLYGVRAAMEVYVWRDVEICGRLLRRHMARFARGFWLDKGGGGSEIGRLGRWPRGCGSNQITLKNWVKVFFSTFAAARKYLWLTSPPQQEKTKKHANEQKQNPLQRSTKRRAPKPSLVAGTPCHGKGRDFLEAWNPL